MSADALGAVYDIPIYHSKVRISKVVCYTLPSLMLIRCSMLRLDIRSRHSGFATHLS